MKSDVAKSDACLLNHKLSVEDLSYEAELLRDYYRTTRRNELHAKP
jgi:hypothetical protein